jgi:hypothetical protein
MAHDNKAQIEGFPCQQEVSLWVGVLLVQLGPTHRFLEFSNFSLPVELMIWFSGP